MVVVVRVASQVCQSGLELIVKRLVLVMSTTDAQINEGNLRDDIDDFLTLYDEIDKYGQDQLLKYIEVLEKLSRAYHHTHNQLKKLCEPHEYTKLYSHYDKEVKRIREYG